jgi:hypothetical protein
VRCSGPSNGDGVERPAAPAKKGFGNRSVPKKKEKAAGEGPGSRKDREQEGVVVGGVKDISGKGPDSSAKLKRVVDSIDKVCFLTPFHKSVGVSPMKI